MAPNPPPQALTALPSMIYYLETNVFDKIEAFFIFFQVWEGAMQNYIVFNSVDQRSASVYVFPHTVDKRIAPQSHL